jgi:hypothetical protein
LEYPLFFTYVLAFFATTVDTDAPALRFVDNRRTGPEN